MKTLVIHPEDPTTAFLEAVYEHVPEKTVIRGGTGKKELAGLVSSHDRIMMMGHGSPMGLLSVRRFPDAGLYIIDGSMTELLRTMKNSVLIWCHADQYARAYNLDGFFTGMFISESGEAIACGMDEIGQHIVDESNSGFCKVAAKYITDSCPRTIYENVRAEYGLLTGGNPVARFNHERLYYNINARLSQLKTEA